MQKQKLRKTQHQKKTSKKTGKTVKFIDNKIKHDKNDGKMHKKKSTSNDTKKDNTSKNDSVTEIHISDLDTRTEIEDNDSSGISGKCLLHHSDSGKTDETK